MKLLVNSNNEPILQGSEEWHFARMNRFTASSISDIIAGTTKPSKDKVFNYATEKAFASFLDMPIIKSEFHAIRRGKMLESEARIEFLRQYKIVPAEMTIAEIEEEFNVGKCYLDDLCEFHLISPDGYSSNLNIGTEFKVAEDVPKYARFCRDVTNNASLKEFDSKYYWQVIDALMCSKADAWYFAYYLPEMKRGYDIRAVKIIPDEAEFAVLRAALDNALSIYKEQYQNFKATLL